MAWKFTKPTKQLKEIVDKFEYHFNVLETAIYENKGTGKDEYYIQDILINEYIFEEEVKRAYPGIDIDTVMQARIVLETYEEDSEDCCQFCGSDDLDSKMVGECFCCTCLRVWNCND